MARRRVRPTGCGKFFIVMLILVPVAFIGASLFTGKNPISAFNELIGRESVANVDQNSANDTEINQESQEKESTSPERPVSNSKELKAMQEDLMAKDRKIERLESQLDLLEKELDKCQLKIQQLEN